MIQELLSPPRTGRALAYWLVNLRWAAIAAQGVVLAIVVFWLGLEVSWGAVSGLLLFEILSNAGLMLWVRRRELVEVMFAGVMAVDVVLLTILLQMTGGPFNPFSFMYLVHVMLAAVTLSRRWAWGLTVMCLGAYGILFSPWLWDPHAHHMHHGAALRLHLEGMWWALAITAGLIVGFAMSLRSVVVAQERELERARERQEQESRLTSLATLAAGAAHELSTPLSTIAVVARELERALESGPEELRADARLVYTEVARCRGVLEQLSLDAGVMMGEAASPVGVGELLTASVAGLGTDRHRVEITGAVNCRVRVPLSGMSQVLRGVIRNGLQAGAATVVVEMQTEKDGVEIRVRDRGIGMSDEVRTRAVEPFFTTRPHGEGMGLGLFLAHRLLVALGGELQLESVSGVGTTVRMWIPCEADDG